MFGSQRRSPRRDRLSLYECFDVGLRPAYAEAGAGAAPAAHTRAKGCGRRSPSYFPAPPPRMPPAPPCAGYINRPNDADFDLPVSRERQRVVIRRLAGARGYRKVQGSKDVGNLAGIRHDDNFRPREMSIDRRVAPVINVRGFSTRHKQHRAFVAVVRAERIPRPFRQDGGEHRGLICQSHAPSGARSRFVGRIFRIGHLGTRPSNRSSASAREW